ncbi:hypothetical protein [Parvibaculum sp.]|uniref:hypothetical protein n=1 Tax=Parvibaculum sp. TaxID=2024848 RepID=UPI003BAA7586
MKLQHMPEDISIYLSDQFPLTDVVSLGRFLERQSCLIPAYVPPPVGLLDIAGLLYARDVERVAIEILPDRNLVSRIVSIAREGVNSWTEPARISASLMAFSQAMDINFEPSIAFHEFAHVQGNAEANKELAWFRSADNAGAQLWIDLALRRRASLGIGEPEAVPTHDLAKPLRRWTRNYIVALKIAELELKKMAPIERAIQLFTWMFEDFLLAGPAALFSTAYFSPKAARRRMIKHLRSPDRVRAIKGIKNAAWDITHLSDFVERVNRDQTIGKRYIFATADKSLASIARLLLLGEDSLSDRTRLVENLCLWWPQRDAEKIVEALWELVARVEEAPQPRRKSNSPSVVSDFVEQGEASVLSWKSK